MKKFAPVVSGCAYHGGVAVVASPSGNQELRHVAQSSPTTTLAISSVPKGVYYLDRGVYARNGETRGVLFTFPQYNLSSRHEVLTHPCQGGDTSCVLYAPQSSLPFVLLSRWPSAASSAASKPHCSKYRTAVARFSYGAFLLEVSYE